MRKFVKIFPKVMLWVLFAISIVIAGLFFLGGSESVVINNNTWEAPNYTNTLIVWSYILFGIAVVVTLLVSIIRFVLNFINNPKRGLGSLLVLVVFVAIFVISWSLGSPEKLEILGYEGTANQGVMAQFTDMCLYVMYILCAGTILALFGSALYSKLK